MSNSYRFRTGFYSIFIDFDMTFVRYSNDVAIKFRSIFDRLRDAFYNSIRYSCKILPFSVYRTIIPVSSGSMKTTAARGTARGQPPFHASLSYCGSQLNVIPSSVSRRKRSLPAMSVCSILSTVRGPLYLRIISASCSSMAPLEPHRPTWDPPDPACLETIKRNKQEFWRKRTHVRKHLASWTATGKVLDSWTATEQIYIYIYIYIHTQIKSSIREMNQQTN